MASTPAFGSDAFSLREVARHLLSHLRGQRTRVHTITSAEARTFTFNFLLDAGGIRSLIPALLADLGRLDSKRCAAVPKAIAAARAHAKPWILNSDFVEASPLRLESARTGLTGRSHVLRSDADELSALAGEDATPETVQAFAKAHDTIAALIGAVGWMTDRVPIIRVENSHPLMIRVNATGCARTTLGAALGFLHGSHLKRRLRHRADQGLISRGVLA
ncbi:hydroxyethylthiazole kinase [Microvirga zambiensis]|uniref:hydroxyethylthiazole kinase n=1 Tax=Microvirga zambiensis TaxID=1402137 RepID=UPI001AEF6481|nr:hydroxyethylthiazole kinase [Microvirga zambiensis]